MRASTIAIICVPLLAVIAAAWGGVFPLDFPQSHTLQYLWVKCDFAYWNILRPTLRAVSHILFPYYTNRAVFAAVYYAACGILWVLESFVTIFEFAFGSIMKELILAPFRASGVSALASKICWEFFSVPQQLESFLEWRAVRVTATVGVCSCWFVFLFRFSNPASQFRRNLRSNFLSSVFALVLTTAFFTTCIADIVVFAILVANLLLPLLCIFATLALLSYAIFRARPNLRPKSTAPCLAVLAAACLHFNADAFDDWMVPFFTLVAALWLIIVVVNRHIFTCLSHVIHWLRYIPRVRARDGGHFTPRGGRLFCDDECAICMEPMQGHEVSARKLRQRCVQQSRCCVWSEAVT